MKPPAALTRGLGWLASASSAAALLSGMAFALAAVSNPGPPVLMLDLSQQPPAAPAVAAVADAAPRAVDEAPDQPALATPMALATPEVPRPDLAPVLPAAQPAMTLPEPETPVQADLSLPPPPRETPPEKVAKAEAKPQPAPEKKVRPSPDKTAKTPSGKPAETAEAPSKNASAAAGVAASKAAPKAAGAPKVSAASYAKAVMKKVRATKKKKGVGRGSVTVGFTVARDGGLASVKVLKSSGNAALDKVALDHIRRSAPFPPPPEGAGRSFSFDFVGK